MSTRTRKPSPKPNPIPSKDERTPEASNDRHWFGLEGAATIQTKGLLQTRIAVDFAVREKVICLVYGDAGLGKTLSASAALEKHRDAGVAVTGLDLPARTRMNGIAAALVRECTGTTPTGNLRHLEEDLWPILAEHQGVIVVDETQRLNHEALEYLRHLHDDPRTNFGMLLIGGYGCWEVISKYPMLESRILVRVRFEPLTLKETLRAMPGYHRIYQAADPELLARIHNECTHGVFRAWAAFTVIAVDLCERLRLETLTEEVAEAAFELLGRGGRP